MVANFARVQQACERLAQENIKVSLFIDASEDQIDAAIACGAPCIEIHTGHFADAAGAEKQPLLDNIHHSIDYAFDKGLQVNAGHGLHFHNVHEIAINPRVVELNIGHALIADALFRGLAGSVAEMKRLMIQARQLALTGI